MKLVTLCRNSMVDLTRDLFPVWCIYCLCNIYDPLRIRKGILFGCCPSVGMSVCRSVGLPTVSVHFLRRWTYWNERFIMIISNGNIMIIALPFTSTRNSLSFFIHTFKMILFVLYKVNNLYNVKGGFGDVCVCVCVCVRGGDRRGVNLYCSFFSSSAII